MRITIDYDDEEQRKQGEAVTDGRGRKVNAGVFPLTIKNLQNFAVCGDREPGVPAVHMHGNFANLICQTVALTERLRLALMQQLVNSVRVTVKETGSEPDRGTDREHHDDDSGRESADK
jgi:hypothetical protein